MYPMRARPTLAHSGRPGTEARSSQPTKEASAASAHNAHRPEIA